MTVRPEKAVQFGTEKGLVGVLTLPALPLAAAPWVVLINSGILHRVGTNRLYVNLARALAGAGVPVLRFDLSAIGDSERRRDAASLRESVELDIREAIDYLSREHEAPSVTLLGLCSGAFDALHAAGSDDRIGGIVMVDLAGPFQGLGHTIHRVKARIARPAFWRKLTRRLARAARSDISARPARPGDASGEMVYVDGARSTPAREWVEQQFARLLARRVRMHFVFTGGFEHNYSHESQFRRAFPRVARDPNVAVTYLPDADHAFSARRERDRLVELVTRWVVGGVETRRLNPPATLVSP